jgi:hypothetical protein
VVALNDAALCPWAPPHENHLFMHILPIIHQIHQLALNPSKLETLDDAFFLANVP